MGSLFIKIRNDNQLVINPIDAVVGIHNVYIILWDKNKSPLQRSYRFKVEVKQDPST